MLSSKGYFKLCSLEIFPLKTPTTQYHRNCFQDYYFIDKLILYGGLQTPQCNIFLQILANINGNIVADCEPS